MCTGYVMTQGCQIFAVFLVLEICNLFVNLRGRCIKKQQQENKQTKTFFFKKRGFVKIGMWHGENKCAIKWEDGNEMGRYAA